MQGINTWDFFEFQGRLSIGVEYCLEIDQITQEETYIDAIFEFKEVKDIVVKPSLNLNHVEGKQSAQFFHFKVQPNGFTFEIAVLLSDYVAKNEIFVVICGFADSVEVLNKTSR